MEIVYILTNESMPGYVKVGKTNDIARRLRELDNTSVPLPFECYFAAEVADSSQVERMIHAVFADHRVRGGREYFKISPERPFAILNHVKISDATPRENVAADAEGVRLLEKGQKYSKRFNFDAYNIPKGAVLTFTRDNAITCIVLSATSVNFDGEEMSLSKAATKALEKQGTSWKAVQGPAMWEYEGETLVDIKAKYEEGE